MALRNSAIWQSQVGTKSYKISKTVTKDKTNSSSNASIDLLYYNSYYHLTMTTKYGTL